MISRISIHFNIMIRFMFSFNILILWLRWPGSIGISIILNGVVPWYWLFNITISNVTLLINIIIISTTIPSSIQLYVECILVTTHLDRLHCTIKNTLITIEITSPITAITNNVAKPMITPLLTSESSPLLSSNKNNKATHSVFQLASYILCNAGSYIWKLSSYIVDGDVCYLWNIMEWLRIFHNMLKHETVGFKATVGIP